MTSPLTTGKRRRRFDKYQLMLGDGMAAMSSSYMNSFDDCNFAALQNKLDYINEEIAKMDNNPNREDQEFEICKEQIIALGELGL